MHFGLHGRRRIRFYLTALVLSCLGPVCLSSAYLVHYSYRNRVALLEQNMLTAANILSVALDRDMAIIQASLEALASSPAIASGNMSAFYAQAQDVISKFPGSDIILADPDGQQIVNSYLPFGSSLPKRNPRDTVNRVFETGRPGISNVFKGALTGRYLLGVDVPVFQDSKIRYELAMTLPVDHLSTLFRSRALPQEWLITILDCNRVVAARSSSQEVYVGKHVESQALLKQLAAEMHGTTEGLNAAGALSTLSFQRSDITGWTVVVSVPKAVMARELQHWLLGVVVGLSALLIFGLGMATNITRIITRSVQSLIAPALALGRGEAVSHGHFELEETNEVANALSRAADLLRKHEATEDRLRKGREEATARADAAEELAAIVEGSDDAIISKTLRGIITSWNRAAEKIYGYAAEEVIGRSVSILVPEDVRNEIPENLQKISRSESVDSYDTTRMRKDGKIIHVSISIAPIKNASGEVVGASTIARDITERKRSEQEREKLLFELQEALARVKTLSGLLPICSYCKKIRNDEGYWQQIEGYIHQHSEAQFSHGICPECYERARAQLVEGQGGIKNDK